MVYILTSHADTIKDTSCLKLPAPLLCEEEFGHRKIKNVKDQTLFILQVTCIQVLTPTLGSNVFEESQDPSFVVCLVLILALPISTSFLKPTCELLAYSLHRKTKR